MSQPKAQPKITLHYPEDPILMLGIKACLRITAQTGVASKIMAVSPGRTQKKTGIVLAMHPELCAVSVLWD
jgi:hypothetical protein